MGRRDDILSKIHPRYLPQIEAARAERRPLGILAPAIAPAFSVQPVKNRIRQEKPIKLNKLESDYLDTLRFYYPGKEIICQTVRLRLSNGQWYKPDFFIPHLLMFVETKGPKSFRGGFENLKTAASVHQWAKFRLVWRVSGQWYKQDVLV